MKLNCMLSTLGILVGSSLCAQEGIEINHNISYGIESVYKNNAADFSDKDEPYYGAFIMYQYLPINSINVRLGFDLALTVDRDNKQLPQGKQGIAAHAASDSFIHIGYRTAPLSNIFVTPLAGMRSTGDSQAVGEQDSDSSTIANTRYSSFLIGGLLDAHLSSAFHIGIGGEYHLSGNGEIEGGLSRARGLTMTSKRQIKKAGRYFHIEVPASYQISDGLSAKASYSYTNRKLANQDAATSEKDYNLGSSKIQLGLMHAF